MKPHSDRGGGRFAGWRGRLSAAVLMMAAVASLAAPARAADAFSTISAAARKEGKLEIWMLTPSSDRVHRALLDAFQRRFDLRIAWKWVALHSVRSTSRLVAEAAVRRVGVDVVGVGSADNVDKLASRGLVQPYPWKESFAVALPTIGEPVERVLPELRGRALAWFDNVYVVAWNTKFVRAQEAPRRLEDFLLPKWRGRFVMNVISVAPLDIMVLELGEERTLALARQLRANLPVLKSGTPVVSNTITIGEAHLGISSYSNVERAQRSGQPQDWRFLDDYVPVMPLHVLVPEGAPHPNAARLFAAWLVTEGAHIVEAMEGGGRISDPKSGVSKALAGKPPNARLVLERSLADVSRTRAISGVLETLFTGAGP